MRKCGCDNPPLEPREGPFVDGLCIHEWKEIARKGAPRMVALAERLVKERDEARKVETMKLYLWEGVLADYDDGVMFALAESEEQARKIILEQTAQDFLSARELVAKDLERVQPRVIEGPFGYYLFGGP